VDEAISSTHSLLHNETLNPPETPRPFPLSPPTPSQQLEQDPLIPAISDTNESDDSLPTIEKMLADTRPAYTTPSKSQRTREKSRSTTVFNDAADYLMKMEVDTQEPEHLISVKRQHTESPTAKLPTSKPLKQKYNEITMDDRTYIEIVSSESDADLNAPPQLTGTPFSIHTDFRI
jgi:hypothetical protein